MSLNAETARRLVTSLAIARMMLFATIAPRVAISLPTVVTKLKII